jgi:hypothetical protein
VPDEGGGTGQCELDFGAVAHAGGDVGEAIRAIRPGDVGEAVADVPVLACYGRLRDGGCPTPNADFDDGYVTWLCEHAGVRIGPTGHVLAIDGSTVEDRQGARAGLLEDGGRVATGKDGGELPKRGAVVEVVPGWV